MGILADIRNRFKQRRTEPDQLAIREKRIASSLQSSLNWWAKNKTRVYPMSLKEAKHIIWLHTNYIEHQELLYDDYRKNKTWANLVK